MPSEKRVIGGWNWQCHSNISPSLTTYLSICPLSHPCSSVTSCRPNIVPTLVYKYTMIHYHMAHEPFGIDDSFLQASWRGFCSAGGWLASFIRYMCSCYGVVMDCRFSWKTLFHSWFICASISKKFSFKMSFRQFLISSSTRKWFAPPRGLSVILPSRKYRATILLAVDRFTPIVAATVK